MNKQDIEKAIDTVRLWNAANDGIKICDTTELLAKVAETWLKLEEYAENNSPFLLTKMQELLNPKPQTDIERIREWACQHEVPTPGRFFRYEDRGELKKLLNELEAEKKEQP